MNKRQINERKKHHCTKQTNDQKKMNEWMN